MNDREPPQDPSPPSSAGEADERSAEQADETQSAATPDQEEAAARAATRAAIEEARRAASEAASKAAVAAREVGRELKDGSAEALEDIRSAAVEAGHRARAVTADVLDRAKSEAARAKVEVSSLKDEAKRAWPAASTSVGETGAETVETPSGAAVDSTVADEPVATPAAADAGDPAVPGEPPSTQPASPPDTTPSSTGFDPNLAAALAYVFAPITGPLFYIIETKNTYVRFHAMQAILFAAAAIISMSVFFVLLLVPLLGRFMFTMAGLGLIVTWLVIMWKALNYEEFRLPFIGDVARSQVRRRTEDS